MPCCQCLFMIPVSNAWIKLDSAHSPALGELHESTPESVIRAGGRHLACTVPAGLFWKCGAVDAGQGLGESSARVKFEKNKK